MRLAQRLCHRLAKIRFPTQAIIAQHSLLATTPADPPHAPPTSELRADRLQAILQNIDAQNALVRTNIFNTLLSGPIPARFFHHDDPDAMDVDPIRPDDDANSTATSN